MLLTFMPCDASSSTQDAPGNGSIRAGHPSNIQGHCLQASAVSPVTEH